MTDPSQDRLAQLSRRQLLRTLGGGLGLLGLSPLALARQATEGLHHAPRARRVIFLCMAGAPSHVDTFDHKPALARDDGKSPSGNIDTRRGARLMRSPFQFSQHGESGLWISELFPELARHADKLCMLHGMHTEVPVHASAFLHLHTGSTRFVRPSMGAWTLQGLGSANENLPGFVTLNPPSGQGGAQNYGSAFLPAATQGMRLGIERESRVLRRDDTGPIPDLANQRLGPDAQRRQLELTRALNERFQKRGGNERIAQGIDDSYQLAFRMQSELPAVLDLSTEDEATLERYGIGQDSTDSFGRQCLHALRLAEAGVRFVEVGQGGWDHHRDLRENLTESCAGIDRPIAALLEDLQRTGLLEDTLVLWGGEFGRTPYAQGNDGRDHNHLGFTTWMAGGGVKGGFAHGATDEHGIEAVEGRMSIHDWHATVLHLLGIDHEQLTYPYAGRDFRLTDVHGFVARDILA